MHVWHSRTLAALPGIAHGTAPLAAGPLTFSGHSRTAVRHARARFLATFGIPLPHLTLGRQVHGTTVRVVDRPHIGAGSQSPATYLPATDGLLTQRPDVTLGVFTADCVPVLLADLVTGWIGALHVGWRGAVGGIVPKALAQLQRAGVRMADLRVWCGPAICARCYTTQDQQHALRVKHALGKDTVRFSSGSWHIDILRGIQRQFAQEGVQARNIEISHTCTRTTRTLPSARRDGPTHANTLTIIQRSTSPHDLRGKDVVVYGLGTQGGGVAAAQYAAAQHARVTVVDRKPEAHFTVVRKQLAKLPIQYAFGVAHATTVSQADVIIVNPAIPVADRTLRRAKKQGAYVTNDVALFRAHTVNPLIGVTGTKGKTTVATWLAHILRRHHPNVMLAGNLRRSPLLEPHAFDGKTPVVLELSSFQLEHCDLPLRLRTAVVTNVYPDHLDRHRTMRAYAAVKAKIFTGQTKMDTAVVPVDSDWPAYAKPLHSVRVVYTNGSPSARARAWVHDDIIFLRRGQRKVAVVNVADLQKQDAPTVRCAVTVAAAADAYGVPLSDIRAGLRTFRGVPERNEIIRRYRGRTFIDNTTATNPVAAAAGIASIPGKQCIAIAGGHDKRLPLAPLIRALNATKCVILLGGTATSRLRRQLRVPNRAVASMAAAVQQAWKASAAGDTITLSPGAASFGMFQNEFDRGAQFQAAVRKLR